MKLEEAHISAPLRTKLAHKNEVDDDEDEIAREDSPRDEQYDDGDAVAEAPLLTSCDLDEDRLVIRVPWLADGSENTCDDDNVANKAPVRRFSDAALTQSDDYELARIDPQSSVTLQYSAQRENDRLTTTAAAAITALRIAQNNLSELRNEVSVPDDKADTERQDLPSGRRLRSRSNSNSSSSSGHSDTPEQAMNVNNLSDDFNILAVSLVSPGERGEELEQVGDESATASEADAATG